MTSASFIQYLELGTRSFREEGGRMFRNCRQETRRASRPLGAGQGRCKTRGSWCRARRLQGDLTRTAGAGLTRGAGEGWGVGQGWGVAWWEPGHSVLSPQISCDPIGRWLWGDQGHYTPPPGFDLEPMELRPDASHKENVPPRPATPLRPGKRLSRSGLEVTGAGSPSEPLSQAGQPRALATPEISCARPAGLRQRLLSLGPSRRRGSHRLVCARDGGLENLQAQVPGALRRPQGGCSQG